MFDIEKIRKAKVAKRLSELSKNEELVDDDHYRPRTDREYALANNRSKKIYYLSKFYWKGEINRDELITKIEYYNNKKCDDQREIKIGHVIAAINANHRHFGIEIWEENPFKCEKCRSSKLSYQKYVRCITPTVLYNNGRIEILESIIDKDEYLDVSNGFCCKDCGHMVEHCGYRIETEKELLDYLTMDPQIRDQQQHDYEALMSGQIYAQEQKEEEQSNFEEEISAAEKLACAD